MNVNFTQTITVRCKDPDALVGLLAEWDEEQAMADITGYMGTHVLADREEPGRYLIIAEFGVLDPGASAADQALRNNDRPETREFAAKLVELIEGEPEYHHYDELYRTG